MTHFQLGFYTKARDAELKILRRREKEQSCRDVHHRCNWTSEFLEYPSRRNLKPVLNLTTVAAQVRHYDILQILRNVYLIAEILLL